MKTLTQFVLKSIFLISATLTVAADGDLDSMKEQIRQLRADNESLHNHLDRQQILIDQLLGKLNKLEDDQAQQRIEQEMLAANQTVPVSGFPELKFKGFSDVSYEAELDSPRNKTHNDTFFLGQFDLMISSQINDRVSFLGEVVFEFDDENTAVLDLERVELTYSVSDLLHIRIGRTHTALGHWNETYHHGSWFQTTVSRPIIYGFEDEGGVLPVHSVGVELFGKKELKLFDIDYSIGLSNGRGPITDSIQNISDGNDEKAINLKLTLAPAFVPGLKFGVSGYADKIPADINNPARNGEIDEKILGAHLIYNGGRLELLAEVSYVDHEDQVSRRQYDTVGYYAQAGYRFERLTPYYRYDAVEFSDRDPFFAPTANDISKHTVGIRWDIYTWNALKLEYSYADKDRSDDSQTITLQSTFTF